MIIFRTKDQAVEYIFLHYHDHKECKKAIACIDTDEIAKIDGIIFVVDKFNLLS
jgi:hypothetical protein